MANRANSPPQCTNPICAARMKVTGFHLTNIINHSGDSQYHEDRLMQENESLKRQIMTQENESLKRQLADVVHAPRSDSSMLAIQDAAANESSLDLNNVYTEGKNLRQDQLDAMVISKDLEESQFDLRAVRGELHTEQVNHKATAAQLEEEIHRSQTLQGTLDSLTLAATQQKEEDDHAQQELEAIVTKLTESLENVKGKFAQSQRANAQRQAKIDAYKAVFEKEGPAESSSESSSSDEDEDDNTKVPETKPAPATHANKSNTSSLKAPLADHFVPAKSTQQPPPTERRQRLRRSSSNSSVMTAFKATAPSPASTDNHQVKVEAPTLPQAPQPSTKPASQPDIPSPGSS